MDILEILRDVKEGTLSIEDAEKQIKYKPFDDELSYAIIDYHRELRTGTPEVIYCEGKTVEQLEGIVYNMKQNSTPNILATRASLEMHSTIKKIYPSAIYHESSRLITIEEKPLKKKRGSILVLTGGTSDIPVAEEAAITLAFLGNNVERLYDVGVAGIHRLLAKLDIIKNADILIVVAGMEGALASVVGGLTDKPVIAVPTSIGYGANFKGVSALLSMLNSCASGVAVVNIDNGFGAGFLANNINRLREI